MVVLTLSMSFVINPLSSVDIAICMNQSSHSVCLVVSPVSFVERSINPDLHALAISFVLFIPFTFVLSTIIKLHQLLLDALDTVIRLFVFKGWEFSAKFLDLFLGSLDLLSSEGAVTEVVFNLCNEAVLFSDFFAGLDSTVTRLNLGSSCMLFLLSRIPKVLIKCRLATVEFRFNSRRCRCATISHN